jgi:histidinol dehydrogenase
MRIITALEFEGYWKDRGSAGDEGAVEQMVREVISAVRLEGDRAVKRFASRWDRSSPEVLEVPRSVAEAELARLRIEEADLVEALEYSRENIRRFAQLQRAQIQDFEVEIDRGLFTGQRVVPVQRAAVYVPAGRFPLVSTVLMGLVPATVAGVAETILLSPPGADGLPDRRILATAALAGVHRIFAVGGAQAIAAAALGTETIPRSDVVVGPGNRFVAAAKRLMYGSVGIDFVAGPTDVLVIADGSASPDLVASDLLAQAEHDAEARARALVPDREFAQRLVAALDRRLEDLPTAEIARASLDAGGVAIIYGNPAEAREIADTVAPEHLELQVADAPSWVPLLRNYGSLFIGSRSAEALGDYSAGINHTLPTSGSARFTGGLSVRHFIKILTTLRCTDGEGFVRARGAAIVLAQAEGLEAHGQSARARSL